MLRAHPPVPARIGVVYQPLPGRALKTALRKFLKASPYVRRLREGRRDEGGDGVTVAWLSGG